MRPETKKRILLGAMSGKKYLYITGLFAVVATNLLDFIAPQVVRFTADSVIGDVPVWDWLQPFVNDLGGIDVLRRNLWICGAAAALAALISGAFGFVRRYFSAFSAEYAVKNLRDRLYGHIQRLPFGWHVSAQTGDIIQRCTYDADVCRNTLANVLPDFTRSIVMIIATSAFMFTMDVRLTLFALAPLPLFIATSIWYHKVITKTFKAQDEAEGFVQSAVQENLSGVRVVRAFGRELFEIDRFNGRNGKLFGASMKMCYNLAAFWTLTEAISLAQVILVVIAGISRVLGGDMTVGTFFTFYTYTFMLTWPARATGRHLSELAKCSISLGRIKEVLDAEEETDKDGASAPPLDGDIVFNNVGFSYEEQPVLKNVSFTLKKGQTLGVLGGTGSGKSTLAYLLTRLYEADEGKITIGGADIRDISREHLRRNTAIVLQEPFLYSKSVGDNIRGSERSSEAIERAATVADIHEDILGFEKGYDTKVGERGVTLSGGQKQRVAIARALVKNAPVMIFDDSLSAVDTQTDERIRNALREHTGDATVILISHRVSTLMRCDAILVLTDGAVEAFGTHAELIRGENTYRRVYELQRGIN